MIYLFINDWKISIFSFLLAFTALTGCRSSPQKGYPDVSNGQRPELSETERCRLIQYLYEKHKNTGCGCSEKDQNEKSALKHYMMTHFISKSKPCKEILKDE